MVFDLIKIFIDRFMTETELILYCDFHGHSRKQNVFIYGCENKHSPGERLKEKIYFSGQAKEGARSLLTLIVFSKESSLGTCRYWHKYLI